VHSRLQLRQKPPKSWCTCACVFVFVFVCVCVCVCVRTRVCVWDLGASRLTQVQLGCKDSMRRTGC
jgi:hypothetical protein